MAKAWTEVRMPERTRKVPTIDIEKAITASIIVQAFSAPRAASTLIEWSKRGRRQPRHQRGILDRVPEPPAAPAELVIGPVAAGGDAERQEDPGAQHPRPHRPGKPASTSPVSSAPTARLKATDRPT